MGLEQALKRRRFFDLRADLLDARFDVGGNVCAVVLAVRPAYLPNGTRSPGWRAGQPQNYWHSRAESADYMKEG
jgi:hypothetical protein